MFYKERNVKILRHLYPTQKIELCFLKNLTYVTNLCPEPILHKAEVGVYRNLRDSWD